MSHGAEETEIKLAVRDAKTARRLLDDTGFRVSKRRTFERNTVFDTPELALRNNALLLRIRDAGGPPKLTYKGRPTVAKHKSREELELEVADATTLTAIFERLEFHPVFRYEKYRTEFEQPGKRGTATLDETPVGVFLELEGTPSWIDRTARRLGFREADYITKSYGSLYLEWCREHGVEAKDMVFSRRSRY